MHILPPGFVSLKARPEAGLLVCAHFCRVETLDQRKLDMAVMVPAVTEMQYNCQSHSRRPETDASEDASCIDNDSSILTSLFCNAAPLPSAEAIHQKHFCRSLPTPAHHTSAALVCTVTPVAVQKQKQRAHLARTSCTRHTPSTLTSLTRSLQSHHPLMILLAPVPHLRLFCTCTCTAQ